MKDHIVEIKDVSKTFVTNSGSLELFTDVNINFYPSTSYALIGESGVGKSTLLHIASGLEKPSSGEVFFGRQNFWDLKASHQALLRLNLRKHLRNLSLIFRDLLHTNHLQQSELFLLISLIYSMLTNHFQQMDLQ